MQQGRLKTPNPKPKGVPPGLSAPASEGTAFTYVLRRWLSITTNTPQIRLYALPLDTRDHYHQLRYLIAVGPVPETPPPRPLPKYSSNLPHPNAVIIEPRRFR